MQVCIFEDQLVSNFFPLVYFRPVYALRCGVSKLREKIELLVPRARIVFHVRPALADYLAEKHPDRTVNTLHDEPTWFVNGRTLADESLQQLLRSAPKNDTAYWNNGDVAAAYIGSGVVRQFQEAVSTGPLSSDVFQSFTKADTGITLVRYPWDLVHRNPGAIVSDFSVLFKGKKTGTRGKIYPGATLLNKNHIIVGRGSVVKPQAVLDAESGPIVIGEGVKIYPHAFIEGPASIGNGTLIKAGAKIYGGTTIGEVCKIGGEVDASIVHSYSNKQHEGFLGHSYIGSWVNIGADTNTSDLKNNYGTVQVNVSGGRHIDTGLQFVGLFMGDHSKSGINVMFDTGSVIGASCNVYGSGLPPRFLPSFSWGNIVSSFSTYRIEKSIETAQRAMARRNVPWTAAYERLFRSVFDATMADRARQRIF